MRGTRTVLASGLLTLVLITGSSARSAADECLAKPNGPTPQGQHWYYRIDHANSGRQCWYLRTEIARTQKASRQTTRDSSDAMAQAVQAPTQPAAPAEKMPPKENAVATPIPWLNVRLLPEPVAAPGQATPVPTFGTTMTAAADNTTRHRSVEPATAASGPPAPIANGDATPMQRAKESQRRQQAQARPEPPPLAIAQIDHTFALLVILFTALAIAGPALHFMERRRRREAINFRPPPLARVVALNESTPCIRAMSRPQPARLLAHVPQRPPDQTERLAHALQQLVDRLQTIERPKPNAVHIRPRGRASM